MTRRRSLPAYRVLLRGEGCDEQDRRLGFFTTRQVKAPDGEAAAMLALNQVRADWAQHANGAMTAMDRLTVQRVRRLRLPWLRKPRGGFCFFSQAGDAEAAALRIERRAAGM